MGKMTLVKILGVVSTVVGFAMTALSEWVDEQKMDEKIEEKVNAALAEYESKEEES